MKKAVKLKNASQRAQQKELETYFRQKRFGSWLTLIGAGLSLAAVWWGVVSVRHQTLIIDETKAQVEQVKTASEHLESGRAFYDNKRYADAISEYRKAIDADPQNAVAYHLLAYALHLTGDDKSAVQAAEKAIALSPDGPWIRYNASLIYWALGDKEKMLDQLRNLKRIEDKRGSTVMIAMLKKDRQFRDIKKLPEVIEIIGN